MATARLQGHLPKKAISPARLHSSLSVEAVATGIAFVALGVHENRTGGARGTGGTRPPLSRRPPPGRPSRAAPPPVVDQRRSRSW
jgi:hypothetical protein